MGEPAVRRTVLIMTTLAILLGSPPIAEKKAAAAKSAPSTQPTSAIAISPIFSQLVMFSFPLRFKTAFEKTAGKSYIREAVLKSETIDQWSEMITVTGAKGLAANPTVTAQSMTENMATGYKRACPDTFASKPFGAQKIGGQDAFIAVVSCGNAGEHSESAVIVAIKGSADYYTIQWAERGPASNQPMTLDDAKWTERLRELGPIRVCPLVAGEPAPYPSCLNQN